MNRWRLCGALLLVLVAACSDEGPRSGPGTLTGTLVSPAGAEGAAYVVLVGEGVQAVAPIGETEVHSRSAGDQTHVVLLHPTGGTLSFEVSVADTIRLPTVLVQEVAGPDDALREGLEAYRVEIVR